MPVPRIVVRVEMDDADVLLAVHIRESRHVGELDRWSPPMITEVVHRTETAEKTVEMDGIRLEFPHHGPEDLGETI